jgi:hypothetical protein
VQKPVKAEMLYEVLRYVLGNEIKPADAATGAHA